MSEIPSKRLHLDQTNQEHILEITRHIFENSGIKNHFQAKYLQECSSLVKNDSLELYPLVSNVNILDSTQWQLAVMSSIAFLRRHNMELTLTAMKNEWKVLINETGFKRGRELDAFFDQIINREHSSFEEKVKEFQELYSLPDTLPIVVTSQKNEALPTIRKKRLKK